MGCYIDFSGLVPRGLHVPDSEATNTSRKRPTDSDVTGLLNFNDMDLARDFNVWNYDFNFAF